MTAPYPLPLEPVLFPKVWGSDRLARLGRNVRPGERIGESWEVADLGTTSASGAGGQPCRSRIAAGPLAGRTLHEAMRLWGRELLGPTPPSQTGEFPLLVKYLDARENLSLQVHPSQDYAASHPEASLKTECWYILDADPGSLIYKGTRPGAAIASLREAIATGRINDLIEAVPAIPGEAHLLPSGTVHALGAGVLVAEVQTPSDTTFRLFDWGRQGRELHIEQGLACAAIGPAPPATPLRRDRRAVISTPFFTLRFIGIAPDSEVDLGSSGRAYVLLVIAGCASLYAESGSFAPVDLATGLTLVIPAAVSAECRLTTSASQRLECLVAELGA
jgi:mannose-6-phosphate isomerase